MMKKSLLLIMLALATITVNAQRRPDHLGHHGHEQGGMPPRRHIECATHEQINRSMQVLENQSFDEKKLEIAELCVTLAHFCVDDLARLASVFSFDENRLKFLIYAYDYCQDPQNYYSLRESFSFRSNFDTLMDKVQPTHGRP